MLVLVGCGGGGGGAAGPTAPSTDNSSSGGTVAMPLSGGNVMAIFVDQGPAGVTALNLPYVSVTVCVPGSASCQTIDHLLLDTGSSGLRILASALGAPTSFPAVRDANGSPIAECAVFVDGVTWGAVRQADVSLAALKASAIPVQVIADPAFASIPGTCSSQGVPMQAVSSFGANGVLGVGAFVQDCGPACAQSALAGSYYACPASGCRAAAVPLSKQVANPAASLPSDNNGVMVQLPAVSSQGAANVQGTLTLGIGTRANNTLSRAVVLDLDSSANLITRFGGRTLTTSFFDTGSNAYFFPSASIPVCTNSSSTPGYFCPVATQSLSAGVQGARNGAFTTVTFSVANASEIYSAHSDYSAFVNIAAPSGSAMFDWGLPFYFGRTVWHAFEQRATSAGTGPYVAF